MDARLFLPCDNKLINRHATAEIHATNIHGLSPIWRGLTPIIPNRLKAKIRRRPHPHPHSACSCDVILTSAVQRLRTRGPTTL
jgi:hypothetical protein